VIHNLIYAISVYLNGVHSHFGDFELQRLRFHPGGEKPDVGERQPDIFGGYIVPKDRQVPFTHFGGSSVYYRDIIQRIIIF